MEKSEVGKSADGFIDRSKVRILLCDNDDKCSEEVFTLLCGCSYQVTSVKSPRQVIDALNAEGPNIDIILSEVDLPLPKGLKMLKYIARDKDLRRIPVIMMSAQDDVPVVVKCLKLGAADYLVKPLRTNELLNLWTHMWRRRRLLGLVEKNVISYDFDMVASDHSDDKTNSTTIFSDDTDEKSRKNPEAGASTHQEYDINTSGFTTVQVSQCPPDAPDDTRKGQISSVPKKSGLKVGESSAFFTYIKSVTSKSDDHGDSIHERAPPSMNSMENIATRDCTDMSKRAPEVGNTLGSHSPDNHPSSNSVSESFSLERSSTPPCSGDISQQGNSLILPQEHAHIRNDSMNGAAGFLPGASPYYFPGMMNHYSIPPYMQNHGSAAMLPHYPNIPQCPSQMPSFAAYTYYPFGVCLQSGQPSLHHPEPPLENPDSNKGQVKKVGRREAALMKFRQKRKERCFDKKIRYVNRKKLADRRPRVRGQFVRKGDGTHVDPCDQSASLEDEEEIDDEDPADLSPDDDTKSHQKCEEFSSG